MKPHSTDSAAGMTTLTPRAYGDAPQLEPASNASPGEIRSTILVTRADEDAFRETGKDSSDWVPMRDHLSGLDLEVRRADCGLGCRCDAEYRLADVDAADAAKWRLHQATELLAAAGFTPGENGSWS